jgi:hypothetical protein
MTIFTAKGVTRPGVLFPRQLNYESKLLFHLRAADVLLGWNDPDEDVARALTGEDPAAFTRATTGGYTRDSLGFVRQWGKGIPRLEMYDLDGDGYFEEPGIMLEGQRENVCLRSQAIATAPWGDVAGSVVSNNDAAAPDRTITATSIEDNGAASVEGRDQDITVADDSTVWCVSVFIKKNATGAICKLGLDLTGGGALAALILLDPADGSILAAGADVRDSGVIEYAEYYRVWVTIDNDSSGNTTATISLFPAWRAAGDLGGAASQDAAVDVNHFWGVQLENAAFPSSYVATVAAAVTRNADALTYTLAWLGDAILASKDDVTVYARMARPFHADVTGTIGADASLYQLSSSAALLEAYYDAASRVIEGQIDTATTDRTASQSVPSGAAIETTQQFRNLRTGGSLAVDVGSGLSAFSAAATAFSAFGDTTLTVGSGLYGALFELKVGRGLRTIRQMRETL